MFNTPKGASQMIHAYLASKGCNIILINPHADG